ncbi:hypothetical protein SAY86_023911 [Trapa natans]|uniref:Uncharacterized protein n=1 Tax=Trapa natans TaxID=22666 RepID=A0AAN7MB81_TRANT|nr:hypothetical protein SAY86_023911 [Trapa natans]
MGTKFEYAVNLLASSPVSSNKRTTFSFSSLDDCQNPLNGDLRSERRTEERAVHSFRQEEQGEEESMEVNEQIQDLESVKKTMLMHENIFRQQVRELHRLYNVQKMLMADLKKQGEQTRRNSMTTATTTTSLTTNSPLIWPCQAMPSPGNFGLERAIMGGISGHGGEPECGCSMEEHEVELTLSIGGGDGNMNKRKQKMKVEKKFIASLSLQSDRSDPIHEDRESGRERKRPHWLFQV